MGEITLEQVDKIRERTNVSYEEAKAALEATGGDMLEAMILLERQGKAGPHSGQNYTHGTGGFYSTRAGGRFTPPSGDAPEPGVWHGEDITWQGILHSFWNILRHCTTNQFEIWRNGRLMTGMPVLVLIILLVFVMWISGPLLLLGLLVGCRYRFTGPELEHDAINAAIEKMHNMVDGAVDKVKDEFKHKRGG